MNKEQTMSIFEMKESLDSAMLDAGGTPLSLTYLRNMTAIDLIVLLAPNGIRFKHYKDLILT